MSEGNDLSGGEVTFINVLKLSRVLKAFTILAVEEYDYADGEHYLVEAFREHSSDRYSSVVFIDDGEPVILKSY